MKTPTPKRPGARPGVGRVTVSARHELITLAREHSESWSRAAVEGMCARLASRGVAVPPEFREAPETPQDHTLRPSVVEALVRARWTPETLHVASYAPVELEASLRRLRGIGAAIAARLVERARRDQLRRDGVWPPAGERERADMVAAGTRGLRALALTYIRERDAVAARTL